MEPKPTHPGVSPPPDARSIFRVPESPLLQRRRMDKLASLVVLCASVWGQGLVPAQVLARPGWAGAGVTPELWWRNAVFYRVDPARFQDSGSTGAGDLAGLAQRLPYLRALGVDALVLDSHAAGTFAPDTLDSLLRAASQNQMRVLLAVTPEMQAGDRQSLLAAVHTWLGMGVAGLYVPSPGLPGTADPGYPALLATLQGMLRSLPGDRVLLAGSDFTAVPGIHARRSSTGLFHAGEDGTLVLRAELPTTAGSHSVTALRESLTALPAADTGTGVPLVGFAHTPPTGSPDAVALAAALLASRADALFDFGAEIGLDTASAVGTIAGHPAPPVMQWTPSNVQQAAAPVERPDSSLSTPGVTAFGPYRPYVHPPPSALTGALPALPNAGIDATLPAELPPPDSLPGFTSGSLPAPPIDGARINVATEERDPRSLLNAYRALGALHHGNQALSRGAQVVLNRDAQNALVWARKAPAGRTGDVVIAANLGDTAVTLALDADLVRSGVHTGSLRPLFQASPTPLTAETTGALMVPPHAVFIGEVRRR